MVYSETPIGSDNDSPRSSGWQRIPLTSPRDMNALAVVPPAAPFQDSPYRPLRPEHVRPAIMRHRPIYRSEHPAIMRGRFFYTKEDDMKLVKFGLEQHESGFSPNGQRAWQFAENIELLQGRSWQSMEGRWKNYIRPSWNMIYPEYIEWLKTICTLAAV